MNTAFTTIIEHWYARHKRDLPWRDTKDAYRIWISEIILQQTRVAQGYDYFLRFIERFPDVQTLAAASEDEVLLLWQGLGYYSRARNLHKAARQIVAMGTFPTDYDAIRRLAGIGDYTAAAIASFAYGLPKAVLDGNVYRVLARYMGIDTPIDTTEGKRLFTALANEMLDSKQPALYNQAIMDFGALQCTPTSPQCLSCPLCETCHALRTDTVTELPVKAKKMKVRTRHLIYIYVRLGHRILLHRRGRGDIWNGLYEPLVIECEEDAESQDVARRHGITVEAVAAGATLQMLATGVRHQLTHQLLLSDFYMLQLPQGKELTPTLLDAHHLCLVEESDRDRYAVPRLVQELYATVAEYDQKQAGKSNLHR